MTAIPETLQQLPAGTGYHKKDGQANLTVIKDGQGNIFIEASCDSLQRVVTMYEEESARLHRLLEEKETLSVYRPTGWQWFWIRLGQIIAILTVIRLGIRKLKNYLKNSKT